MALRYNIDKAFIKDYPVLAANTVRKGVPVMLSGTSIVECNSQDDLYIGVAYVSESGTWPAPALSRVGVVMRGSPCTVPVRSTAAGITAGQMQTCAAAGTVNVVVGGGAVLCNVVGQALETATADGELVACNLGAGCATVSA